jgi:uncharacterized membrane protein YfcA
MELLNNSPTLQWMLAFNVMAVTDVCWAMYTVAAAKDNSPVNAAAWAVALFLLGGIAVVGYTTNPVLLIPSAVGAFVGTYIGVKLSQRKTK